MTEIPEKLLDDSNKNDSTTCKDAFFFLCLNGCKIIGFKKHKVLMNTIILQLHSSCSYHLCVNIIKYTIIHKTCG